MSDTQADLEHFEELFVDASAVEFLREDTVAKRWPIAFQVPAEPWTYTIYISIPPFVRKASEVSVKVRVRDVSGETWVGLLRNQRDFLTRVEIGQSSLPQDVVLRCEEPSAIFRIVLQSGAGTSAGSVTLESVSLLVPRDDPSLADAVVEDVSPAAGNGKQPAPAALLNPSKTVTLGRETFKIFGLSEHDPYFAGLVDNYESEFQAFCRRYVAPNAICIDVGANIGVKTVYLSRHVRRGRVLAIEAAPGVAKYLRKNVEANGASNVECVEAAIGDRIGTVRFSESSAYGHISHEGVEVPMTTLQELVSRRKLPRVDFIKIDVEGFEFPILRSAYELIDYYRSLVLFEFNSWCQLAFADVSPKEFLTWIFDHFKYVQVLNRGGKFGSLTREVHKEQLLQVLHENLLQNGCVTDFIVTNEAGRL